MRAHLLRTALLLAVLSPGGIAAAPRKKRSIDPNAALIARARSATAALLRDPGSAQFRNIRIVEDILGNKVVCGEVNARNGYGGYGGHAPFVFNSRAAIFDGEYRQRLDYLSLARACSDDPLGGM